MLFTSRSAKPARLKFASYPGPGGTFSNREEPVLFVVCVYFTPVALFVSVTTVSGTTAPLESVTTPVIEETSCANSSFGAQSATTKRRREERIFLLRRGAPNT